MRYTEYRDAIEEELRRCPEGLTWAELKSRLDLPQKRACPTWSAKLEVEIGLTRERGVWRVVNR